MELLIALLIALLGVVWLTRWIQSDDPPMPAASLDWLDDGDFPEVITGSGRSMDDLICAYDRMEDE